VLDCETDSARSHASHEIAAAVQTKSVKQMLFELAEEHLLELKPMGLVPKK
jgi:hypothetical protein